MFYTDVVYLTELTSNSGIVSPLTRLKGETRHTRHIGCL